MEGPPRFLQGWSPALAPTLTHLEIGRAAGVPATLLISSLSTLNHLESLRIRGMQSAAVPMLLSRLPSLRVFDTDYNSGGLSRWQPMLPAPRLRELTIRASSLDSNDSPKLWEWITRLIPASAYTDIVDQRDPTVRGTCDLDEISIVSHAQPQAGPGYGLESFTLYAGSVIFSPLFTTYLNAYHRFSLRKLLMGSTEVTNLSQFCHSFGAIEELECSVSITNAVRPSRLRLVHPLLTLQNPVRDSRGLRKTAQPPSGVAGGALAHPVLCTDHGRRRRAWGTHRLEGCQSRRSCFTFPITTYPGY